MKYLIVFVLLWGCATPLSKVKLMKYCVGNALVTGGKMIYTTEEYNAMIRKCYERYILPFDD